MYFKGKPTTPSDIDHFANYSYNVCKQFYPIHPILQVWNEWSIDHKKPSSAQSYQSAVDYFNLVKAVSKKINGKCTLIAGDFNLNIPNDYMWGRTLVGLGLTNYIDGISIHMYDIKPLNIPNPRRTIELLSKFNDYLSSNHINTGLYVTEIGLPTYTWTKYTPKEVSLYAKKLFDLSKSYTFIKGIWWYDLIDDGNDKNNGEDNFGIFDYLGRDKGFSHDYIQ